MSESFYNTNERTDMKKIWLCAASGMLGSHFKRLLEARNIPFIGTDQHEIDITRIEEVAQFVATHQFSHIINCAAYTQVDLAEEESQTAFLVNEQGIVNLALAAKPYQTKIVHFSTDYVFDGLGKQPYKEEDFCHPLSEYGKSKRQGELKLLEILPYSLILRTSWLFGWPGKNFVGTILRLMKEKETLKIVCDQMGRPTYCEDLAQATLALMKDHSGIFHFANQGETSWFEFAYEIYKQALRLQFPSVLQSIIPISSEEYPTKAKRPAYSTLDTHKIESILKTPIRHWSQALNDYLRIYGKKS